MIKNFIRHSRPHGENEVKQTISDVEKQIKYLESIGGDEYDIRYYKRWLVCLKQRLARLEKRKGRLA